MRVPDNEGRVCDAVVRTLEKWTRETRSDVSRPDKEGGTPPVDLRLKLGSQEYAIEHTRIESINNQIATVVVANQIVGHIRKAIPEPFSSLAYYELQFPIDVSLPKGRVKREQALGALVEWIRKSEKILRDRNSNRNSSVRNPYWSNDRTQGTPPGFDCEFELLQWPIAQFVRKKPGSLWYRFIPPDDLESPRVGSLRRTFSKKCPKLQDCKADGARTVLVLESGDPGFVSLEFRGDLLPSLLSACTNAPDEIFLVETCRDPWSVQLLKRDEAHWPDTGMPEMGVTYYDPDPSPLPGIPEWLDSIPQGRRDALQLDRMYTPFLPGWAPATFAKDELIDLTCYPEADANCPRHPTRF